MTVAIHFSIFINAKLNLYILRQVREVAHVKLEITTHNTITIADTYYGLY